MRALPFNPTARAGPPLPPMQVWDSLLCKSGPFSTGASGGASAGFPPCKWGASAGFPPMQIRPFFHGCSDVSHRRWTSSSNVFLGYIYIYIYICMYIYIYVYTHISKSLYIYFSLHFHRFLCIAIRVLCRGGVLFVRRASVGAEAGNPGDVKTWLEETWL